MKDTDTFVELDLRGLRCPLPVVNLEAKLRRAAPGTRFRVTADDPIAAVDIPHFARAAGQECVRIISDDASVCVFEVTATTGEKP